jgi:hypothetical protein
MCSFSSPYATGYRPRCVQNCLPRLFEFVPMAPITLTAMLAITAAYVLANEWAKRAFGARAHF